MALAGSAFLAGAAAMGVGTVIWMDVSIGGTPVGRLTFSLAPREMLPNTIDNFRSLVLSERRSIEPGLTYHGCAFAWSPSYVEGPQYKFSHVCDGNGKRAVRATDDGAVLSRCAVRVFGGTTYYGLRLCPDGGAAGAADGTTTSAGTVLTVPVAGPGRGKSRFAIVRVADSPPAWRERLLINTAVVGGLISGSEVVTAMATASAPPVVLASGELSPEAAAQALATAVRLRGGAAIAPAPHAPCATTPHNKLSIASAAGLAGRGGESLNLFASAPPSYRPLPRSPRGTTRPLLCASGGAPSPPPNRQPGSSATPLSDTLREIGRQMDREIALSEAPVSRSWDPSLPPYLVVPNLLRALQANDAPTPGAGLRTFYDWTHELYRGRPVNGHGDFDIFAARATRSELGALIGAKSWATEPYSQVGDGQKYGTHVVTVFPRGNAAGAPGRRYLFQLRRELRPPYNGAWAVWGVIVSDAGGNIQDLTGGF